MFEKFDIPAVFFPIPAVMSLFASGRQNGIALDCGHDVTHVAPVYQGIFYLFYLLFSLLIKIYFNKV